jgi:hypothetical protein
MTAINNSLKSLLFSRAVNNELLDTYQLKSLDGIFEAPVELMAIRQRYGKLYLEVRENLNIPYSRRMDSVQTEATADAPQMAAAANDTKRGPSASSRFIYHDNFAAREPYDRVVRCLGFSFNDSIFSQLV